MIPELNPAIVASGSLPGPRGPRSAFQDYYYKATGAADPIHVCTAPGSVPFGFSKDFGRNRFRNLVKTDRQSVQRSSACPQLALLFFDNHLVLAVQVLKLAPWRACRLRESETSPDLAQPLVFDPVQSLTRRPDVVYLANFSRQSAPFRPDNLAQLLRYCTGLQHSEGILLLTRCGRRQGSRLRARFFQASGLLQDLLCDYAPVTALLSAAPATTWKLPEATLFVTTTAARPFAFARRQGSHWCSMSPTSAVAKG
jgi:hypothetical protein